MKSIDEWEGPFAFLLLEIVRGGVIYTKYPVQSRLTHKKTQNDWPPRAIRSGWVDDVDDYYDDDGDEMLLLVFFIAIDQSRTAKDVQKKFSFRLEWHHKDEKRDAHKTYQIKNELRLTLRGRQMLESYWRVRIYALLLLLGFHIHA